MKLNPPSVEKKLRLTIVSLLDFSTKKMRLLHVNIAGGDWLFFNSSRNEESRSTKSCRSCQKIKGYNRIHSLKIVLALSFVKSEFRIDSRGIVPPYRTTTGPTSEFLPSLLTICLFSHFRIPNSDFPPSHLLHFSNFRIQYIPTSAFPLPTSDFPPSSFFRLPHSHFRIQYIPTSNFVRSAYSVLPQQYTDRSPSRPHRFLLWQGVWGVNQGCW